MPIFNIFELLLKHLIDLGRGELKPGDNYAPSYINKYIAFILNMSCNYTCIICTSRNFLIRHSLMILYRYIIGIVNLKFKYLISQQLVA